MILVERKEVQRGAEGKKKKERIKKCDRACNRALKEEDKKKVYCTEHSWKNKGHTGRCTCSRCCKYQERRQGLIDRYFSDGEKYVAPYRDQFAEEVVEELERQIKEENTVSKMCV